MKLSNLLRKVTIKRILHNTLSQGVEIKVLQILNFPAKLEKKLLHLSSSREQHPFIQ